MTDTTVSAPPKRKRHTVTVRKIGEELYRAVELRKMLSGELEGDPQLLIDTIEGETELCEACLAVYDEILEDEIMLEGIKAVVEKLQARAGRIAGTVETRRNIILRAIDTAGVDTIKGPLVTLSRGTTNPKLIVNDEAKIPSDYFKVPDPVLDRKALKDALDAGTVVDGASLSNGGISLTARVK